MKYLLFVCLIIFLQYSNAQDNTFVFLSNGGNDITIVRSSALEQKNKPLLVYKDKIYIIGSDCIIDVFRNKGGDTNKRNSFGHYNNRNKGGDIDSRNKGSDMDSRNKGGDLDSRNKGGDMDSRNKGGDMDSRNKGSDMYTRNKSGNAIGSSCKIAENGKLLIYTYLKISTKKSKIYYNENYYNKKYFKIIKI